MLPSHNEPARFPAAAAFTVLTILSWIPFGAGWFAQTTGRADDAFFGSYFLGGGVCIAAIALPFGVVALRRKNARGYLLILGFVMSPVTWYLSTMFLWRPHGP